jgi:glycosyltransferase involved in cell wall biosynthesis
LVDACRSDDDRPQAVTTALSNAAAMPAIHQFHGSSSVGDAITNGLFYTRKLLHGLGFRSEIYCEDVEPRLAGAIRSAATFPDDPETILLLHYSWAIRSFDWLRTLKCRKVLVFHNITPSEFFEPDSAFAHLSMLADRQIRELRSMVDACLAPSAYNAQQLRRLGFDEIEILPLLFDGDAWRRAARQAAPAPLEGEDCFHILFVGRIVEHKRQEDLLLVLDRLRGLLERPVRLTLVGSPGGGDGYLRRLQQNAREFGLGDLVSFAGKLGDAEIHGLYRNADVFLCLSEHEGFCVPLLEAMASDLPVVAYGGSAIGETVGEGGLVLRDKEPSHVAAILKTLAEEPGLRRELVAAGRRNLQRFACDIVRQRLAAFLACRFALAVSPPDPASSRVRESWRIEGPFDSSYSLALVNRSLAHALNNAGTQVALVSTEGPGDFEPDAAFLAANPETRALWRSGPPTTGADVVLRNLFPPRVTDMRGATRVLAGWAWEESRVPPEWVGGFNRHLDLITVVSHFVAKALVDSGVRVPIAVVGNGTDHVAAPPRLPVAAPATSAFRFLHISSALPRKGVDILLEAWGRAFTADDDVLLLLKTFPNPHNDVEAQLSALRARYPHHASVVHIEADLPESEIAGLYEWCDVVVLPTRGEGFCLPAAEALRRGRPVIVTDFGGSRDFCRSDCAWTVDFAFRKSQAHFGLFDSVWAEPDAGSLVAALHSARRSSRHEREKRAANGRPRLETVYTWQAVAERTRLAVDWVRSRAPVQPLPVVAWITTWNTRCGIASYSRHLTAAFPRACLRVFASRTDERLSADEPFVRRSWTQGQADPLDELYGAIRASGATVAVLQFNFSFFAFAAFGRLLDRLRAAGVRCFVTLHSTMDYDGPDKKLSLNHIRPSLAAAHRLLVHAVPDLEILKAMGLVDNVGLLPHGTPTSQPAPIDRGRSRRYLACFGYLLPHKGFPLLLRAFFRLQRRHPDLHLLMLTSLYPAPVSDRVAAECRALIDENNAGRTVTLMTEHKHEDEILAVLSNAELIVFPYQHTQESASGAIRFALGARRPVICTPVPIFDDVADVVHFFPGMQVDDLEQGLEELLGHPSRLEALASRQTLWLADHDWKSVSTRLWNMLRAEPPLDLLSGRVAADA